jgi:hypothetical protein
MHVDERDEVAMSAQQRRRRKTRCAGGSCLLVIVTRSMVATRIYRKDLTRVTASRNLLGLSLSKRIRHGLIEKINCKMRPWTYEASGRILGSRPSLCLATPRHALPDEARRGERARVCLSLSPLLYTLASV